MIFTYSVVKHSSNSWVNVIKSLQNTPLNEIKNAGGGLYGIWTPQIGLYSNELIVMFIWPDDLAKDAGEIADRFLLNLEGIVKINTTLFKPTARPLHDAPPERKGMYIHRWMTFETSDLPEAVALSKEAWVTFEDKFDATVIGLFQDLKEQNGLTRLLLITWYRDFKAWQDSRNAEKEPKSWDNFMRRHEMTRENIGLATGLWVLK
ncbi:MAG: hypothetical protein JRG97_06545 [Deltaproteobacteria bacterium]|nr:hypothetical protein [Deltaproteobacteria bacterium]